MSPRGNGSDLSFCNERKHYFIGLILFRIVGFFFFFFLILAFPVYGQNCWQWEYRGKYPIPPSPQNTPTIKTFMLRSVVGN